MLCSIIYKSFRECQNYWETERLQFTNDIKGDIKGLQNFVKKWKKLLTNVEPDDNIMKLSERDGKKYRISIERLKKIKKVVDKLQKRWYDIKVVAENKNNSKEPW